MSNKAEKAIRFIENLMVPKGKSGNTRFLLMEWQKDFIRKLFGTLTADGLRQYVTALLLIPKKNGKSTLSAAIALYCLFCENEVGGEIYSAANTRDQAKIVFNAAAQMIRSDPYLYDHCKIVDSKNTIYYPRTNSFYKALSADAGDKNGLNPSVIVYDEICEAPTPDLFEKLQTGTASRQQPLTLCISTAGDKGTIGHQLYEHGCKVRDGIIHDPTFLPVIYEAKSTDDHEDEKVWQAANPSWGIIVEPKYMKKAIQDAANMPTRLNDILRYHLNIWVDRNVSWIPAAKWAACNEKYNPADLLNKHCYMAIDLSSTTDITAVVLLFPLADGRYAVVCRFYVPKDKAIERQKRDRQPYLTWINQGSMIATEGPVVDYDRIRADINELKTQYDIKAIAIDRWNATQLSTQLTSDGFEIVPFGQGYVSMNAPSKELEKLIISQKILHNDDPVLKWMISNVVAETDAADNVKPSKARSSEKIDGVVAMVMALGVAITKGTDDKKSVYEERGILRF
jgi:phage terminase large subunit-like protein